MTCHDFQLEWDAILDAEAALVRPPGPQEGRIDGGRSIEEAEARLLAHAADCPTCRPIAARYQALRRAIRAWRRPPQPPADLVDRILAIREARSPARRSRWSWRDHRALVGPVAGLAAAVVLLMGILGVLIPAINRAHRDGPPEAVESDIAVDLHSASGPRLAPGSPRALDRALAEATSATWDLALSASGPATRLGREVFDVTTIPGEGEGKPPSPSPAGFDGGLAGLSVSKLDPLGSEAAEATAALQQVGDQLSAGVRPLSSTARHAFGFLLGPPPVRAGARPGVSTSTGARSG